MTLSSDLASRAEEIATRRDRDAALEFVSQNPIPADLSAFDSAELRRWADIAFAAGMRDAASKMYLRLSELEPQSCWPLLQLGRLHFERKEYPRAATAFWKATTLAGDSALPWYELIGVLCQQQNIAKLKEAVAGLLKVAHERPAPEQADTVISAAHFLFERRLRDEPLQVYARLIDWSISDSLIQARYAECLVAKGQFAAAVALLEPLREAGAIGDWGLRSLAVAYAELGQAARAAALLEELVRRHPTNVHHQQFLLRLLCQLGERAAAAGLLRNARSSLARKDYEDLHVIGLIASGEYTALAELLSKHPRYGTAAVERELARAVSDLVHKKKDVKLASTLAAQFISRFGKNINLFLTLLNAAFATRDWNLARLCLASLSEADFESNLELRLKRFEFYCFTGALEEAKSALASLEPVAQLPSRRAAAVLRYYGEIGDWEALYRLSMQRLDGEFEFERIGYLVFRAVRKTGKHMEAIRRIEQVQGLTPTSDLKRLRTIIMEDMILNNKMLEKLSEDPHLADLPAVHQRLLFKKLVLRQRRNMAGDRKRYAIFYCTNSQYLGPALVSLGSLIDNNRELIEASDVYIVAEDEAYDLALKLLTRMSKRYQVDVHVKTRAEVLSTAVTFKTNYGLFTAGHSLADAAYYRIYFARELYLMHKYEKALYIDSDTIIRGSLREVFDRPPTMPLFARLEEPRPEVDIAIRLNNLRPGRYFNSGVILFDLSREETERCLSTAIETIGRSPNTLVFHDQCALNIGFKEQFGELEFKFNHFVKPDKDEPLRDAVIVHYLDRPKPWDPAYSGKLCGLWFENWYKLAIHIGGGEAMKLYKLSNVD